MTRDWTTVVPPRASRTLVFVVFAATFLFRWLTIDFDNDYFMHLAWAAEMLRGDWPVRDFVEPGFPLQTVLAYLGLRLGGYQLFWEAVIACAMIAGGATFTLLACVRLGVPRWLAVAATLVAIAAYPRLYAYPKAVAYPAAVWALALYVSRPATSSVALAGVITAIAFLLRHDHGVYAGIATVLGFVLYHRMNWRGSLRAILVYAGTAALVVAPWLAWVQASGHGDQYWDFLTGQSRGLVSRQRLPELSLSIDTSQPLVRVAPIVYPRVGIRWAPGASLNERRTREKQYGLERLEDDPAYRLTSTDISNVRALVQDPAVEDTSGIDRGSLRVPDALFPWMYLQLQRYVPIVRLRILPGIVNASNALPWLIWVAFVLPAVVLALGLIDVVRRSGGHPEAAVVIAAAVLSAITYQTLVRASPDSRLGDIAALGGILLAWTSSRAWNIRGLGALLMRPIVLLTIGLTLVSAMTFGRVVTRLEVGGIDGPTKVVRHARAMAERYRARPLEVFAPTGTPGLPGISRWLNACTEEQARVALIGFEPQVMVIAERGFAGGMAFYDLGWMSSDRDQRLTLDRWARQDVPTVVAMQSEWESFSRDYPLIRAFIDKEYRVAQRGSFGGAKEATVFVKISAKSVRTDRATGLPCFR